MLVLEERFSYIALGLLYFLLGFFWVVGAMNADKL